MTTHIENWERAAEDSLARSRQRRSAPPKHILTRQNAGAAILTAIVLAVFAFALLLAASLAVQP